MSAAARSQPARLAGVRGAPPGAALALGLAAVAPLLVAEGGVALQNMVLAAAYVIMALGLNVVVGFAGLLDLGYVAFFAIGAHVAAHFGSEFWAGAHVSVLAGEPAAALPGIHLNFLIVLVLAVAATTAAGVFIGVPTLRLRGDYVGIVTLAFGEIIGQAVVNGRQIELFGGSLTGGPSGMSGVDRIDLPLLGRFGALDLRPWYWFALALVVLVLLVNFRLRDSRVGRAWIALRDDEAAAASAGVAIARTKLLAYGVGAAMGGVSGAFLASYFSFVDPHQFTFSFSIFILAMVVLGGLGSIWGVVVGAIVLSAVNNYLLPEVLYDVPGELGLDFNLSEISSGIYGFLLVIVMLVRPKGLLPLAWILAGRREGCEAVAAPAVLQHAGGQRPDHGEPPPAIRTRIALTTRRGTAARSGGPAGVPPPCAHMHIAFYEHEPAAPEGVLLKALRRDVRFQYVALADGAGYEVAYEEGEPDGSEGVTLVNPFEVPAGEDERFLAAWHEVRAAMSGARGYLGTRLHHAESADFRYVDQARWSSPLMVQRASSAVDAAVPFTSHPGLYLVV